MAENFDLIFGQNASQQYAWSDNDYQKGWETIGNIPPTAAQFDALQRRSDTKLKELNDELTPLVNADTADSRQPSTTYSDGDIKYSSLLPTGWFLSCVVAGTTSAGEIVLPSPVVENVSVIDGTVTWKIRKPTTGEIPNASSTVAGITKLYTGIGDNTDGTMTQKAIKAIVGTGGGIIAAGIAVNGYIKFADGVIVQWGRVTGLTDSAANMTVTFPISFPNNCFTVIPSPQGSYREGASIIYGYWKVKSKSNTNFVIAYTNNVNWIAVGN